MLLVAEAELEMLERTVLTEPLTLNCDSARESLVKNKCYISVTDFILNVHFLTV